MYICSTMTKMHHYTTCSTIWCIWLNVEYWKRPTELSNFICFDLFGYHCVNSFLMHYQQTFFFSFFFFHFPICLRSIRYFKRYFKIQNYRVYCITYEYICSPIYYLKSEFCFHLFFLYLQELNNILIYYVWLFYNLFILRITVSKYATEVHTHTHRQSHEQTVVFCPQRRWTPYRSTSAVRFTSPRSPRTNERANEATPHRVDTRPPPPLVVVSRSVAAVPFSSHISFPAINRYSASCKIIALEHHLLSENPPGPKKLDLRRWCVIA